MESVSSTGSLHRGGTGTRLVVDFFGDIRPVWNSQLLVSGLWTLESLRMTHLRESSLMKVGEVESLEWPSRSLAGMWGMSLLALLFAIVCYRQNESQHEGAASQQH